MPKIRIIKVDNLLVPYKIWRDEAQNLKQQMLVVKANDLVNDLAPPLRDQQDIQGTSDFTANSRVSILVNKFVEEFFKAEKFKQASNQGLIPNGTIMTSMEYVEEFCHDLCLDKEGWKRVKNFYIDDVSYKWIYNG